MKNWFSGKAYLSILPLFLIVCGADGSGQPVELGQVNWLRNMPDAIQQAEKTDKPIFLLFQEVPGCSTCQNFGKEVLGHPLIVEAIETYFVPLAIFNNKGGSDKQVLGAFKEPSWNNPGIRIVDQNRKDIIPRHSGRYTPGSVVQTIVKAMKKDHQPIPEYLQLLQDELSANTKVVVPSMYCFWTGEKVYGSMDGVISTEPGFVKGREVVKVKYDPNRVTEAELLKMGKHQSCADQVFDANQSFSIDGTPQYYLSHTALNQVPLSPSQRTKINARIGNKQAYHDLLSPFQQQLLATAKSGDPLKSGEDWKESYFLNKNAAIKS